MKIKSIQPFIVSHKLEKPFFFSQWQYESRTLCLVKITLEDGTYGWGEGYGPATVIKSCIEFFSPHILGMDALQHENIWQIVFQRSLDFARKGIFLSALSAIDVALWDIKGKILEQPVSILLGGRKREKVKAYATGMYFSKGPDLPKRLAEEAIAHVENGFNAMKMKVGLSVRKDIDNVKAVREAIGPDIDLMIDANHAYNLREAAELAKNLESYRIGWFEEPVSPEDYQGYRELRQRTGIPISGGECEYLCSGFLTLFQNQCVDIAQPDICAAGGLTEVKRIADLARAFGMELIPHTWGTGINVSAALHLISNLDMIPGRMKNREPLLELDRTENPLRDKLIQPTFFSKNGYLNVPDAPGLGVDVDEDVLEVYLLE
jgi:D-galactarolactone cycloisomerase